MARPPRLCSCGQVVPHGTICACQRESIRARNRRHDARRPSSRERGYTAEWEAFRREFLAHHPTCRMCGAEATLIDHIRPHRGNRALFWSVANMQPLCTPCHASTKQRQERQAEASRDV